MSRFVVLIVGMIMTCSFLFVKSQFLGRPAIPRVVPNLLGKIPGFEDFGGYLKAFNKTYNDIERALRNNILLDNVKRITEHNAKALQGKHTYSMAINFFSDMTSREVNQIMNGFKALDELKNASIFEPPPNTPEINEIDWRTLGLVTPVKSQGFCGSCWAFSAIGSIEGQHKKKTGKLEILSEQHLLDCSVEGGNQGCNGGAMSAALEFIKENGGVNKDSCYSYEAKATTCRFKEDCAGATVSGYVKIPSGDENSLKKAVAIVGPIATAIDSSNTGFHYYKSGIYLDENCSSENLSHGVLIVGFGTEDGRDYWLVKNSWGETWGEGGYIKMARNNNNHCGIATRAIYPLV